MLLAYPLVAIATSWEYYVEFTVTDNSSTSRTFLPILTGIDPDNIIDYGYLNSSGNETAMFESTSTRSYGVTTGNITLLINTLYADQEKTFKFYTGYSPAAEQSIIVGEDGYVVVSDAEALEPADNFGMEFEGIILSENRTYISKSEAIKVYSLDSGNLTADIYEALSWQDIDDGTFTESQWVEAAFSADIITQIGIKLWNDDVATQNVNLYEVNVYDDDTSTWISPTSASGSWTNMSNVYDNDTGTTSYESVAGETWSTMITLTLPYPIKSSNLRYWASCAGTAEINADGYMGDVDASVTEIVSAGKHKVEILANSTNLTLEVDDVIEDTVALSGASVINNSNDWYFYPDPCWDYYKHYVSSALVAHYAITEMVSGTTLPDIENSTYNGTIIWGSNPDNIIIAISGITSYEDTTPSAPGASGTSGTSYALPDAEEPTGWFVSGTYAGALTPEIKEVISGAATDIGMPEQSFWVLLWFGIAVAIGFGVVLFTGSILIAFCTVIAVLWGGVNAEVIDFGLVMITIILGFGGMYLQKQH